MATMLIKIGHMTVKFTRANNTNY